MEMEHMGQRWQVCPRKAGYAERLPPHMRPGTRILEPDARTRHMVAGKQSHAAAGWGMRGVSSWPDPRRLPEDADLVPPPRKPDQNQSGKVRPKLRPSAYHPPKLLLPDR
jgi:hypothetical protein